MSIQKIIQESINSNPLEMKEALAEELRNRVAEALAAKMEEVELDEEVPQPSKAYMMKLKSDYHGKDKLSRGQMQKMHKELGTHTVKNLKHIAGAGIDHVSQAAKQLVQKRFEPSFQKEEVELDEAVEVRHDRYMRSHGKKASGSGGWFFTHKSGPVNNLDDNKEVHFHQGKFSDAAKSAKEWAKKNGHSAVYVMEEVEQIDEFIGLGPGGKVIAKAVKKTFVNNKGNLRFSVAGRADSAEAQANKLEKQRKERERLQKARERLQRERQQR